MNTYLLLLIESVMCVGLSLVVLAVLSRPLVNVLNHICPDERAALFWMTYTKVMLVVAPLLLVLLVDLFARHQNPMDSLRLSLMAALTGVLFGLYLLGKRLSGYERIARTTGANL
ncbi:MAG: hypothetical protein RL497_364 [Pseudomonadota bacterium]|jgi:hypothetical protein